MLSEKETKVLTKRVMSVNQKNELNFKVPKQFDRASFGMLYVGDIPIGISSIDMVADFQTVFGLKLQKQGTKTVVDEVIPDSPADDAGVKAGDELKTIHGTPPKDTENASQLLRDADVEKASTVEVVRLGRSRVLMLKPRGVAWRMIDKP